MPDRVQQILNRLGASASSSSLPPAVAPTIGDLATARGLVRETEEFYPSRFTWSASRARLFQSNKEEYWLRYYGGFGGWESKAPKSVQTIYRRGKMKNLAMWIGTEVHQQIQETIVAIGGDPRMAGVHPSIRKIIAERTAVGPTLNVRSESLKMAVRMRKQYEQSVLGTYVHSPKKILRLMEHEGGGSTRDMLAVSQSKAMANYEAFSRSRWTKMLRDPRNILRHADALEEFMVGDVSVIAGPDMMLQTARRKGGMTMHIVDWKTNLFKKGMSAQKKAAKLAEYNQQLNVYALFAQKTMGIDPKDMRLVLAHMQGGQFTETVRKVTLADLQETESWIIRSANQMRAKNVSPLINIADPANFLTGEMLQQTYDPVAGVSAHAETLARGNIVARERSAVATAGQTIENVLGPMWQKIPTSYKVGGALGGLAILGWWMFGDSQKRSRRGDPRARGYGWSPADARINPGVSTARMMYEGGGFGGIA